MKALTFETAMKELGIGKFDEWVFKRFFDLARQGMIPEDEAVRVPPVSEWPRHATAIRVTYDWDCIDEAIGAPVIAIIQRPIPAWTPKVGDAVFIIGDDKTQKKVGVFVGEWQPEKRPGEMYVRTGENEWIRGWKGIKPFDASKIGLPWEQI